MTEEPKKIKVNISETMNSYREYRDSNEVFGKVEMLDFSAIKPQSTKSVK